MTWVGTHPVRDDGGRPPTLVEVSTKDSRSIESEVLPPRMGGGSFASAVQWTASVANFWPAVT